jgi:NADP-dependent 3-hydroxy acid dehydrogenase YdfG
MGMLLRGKTAIVYGAGGAVGSAVSGALAREGARVVLAGRMAKTLDAVQRQIESHGGSSEVRPVDALDRMSVASHLAEVVARVGPVRVMFNAISWDDVQGQALSVMDEDAFMAPVTRGTRTWYVTGGTLARHMAENG